MAELEIVGFDSVGKELEAPQGADTYVAKKAVSFEQPIITVSVNGRNITDDGTKLDLITVTLPINLDTINDAIAGLSSIVTLTGVWDATSGTFPVATAAGQSWIVSVSGTLDGIEFTKDDRILAIVDTPSISQYAGEWLKLDYSDLVTRVNGMVGDITLAIEDIAGFDTLLNKTSIDTLAKLNTIVEDATLTDIADQATAAQGLLASTAVQPEQIDTLTELNTMVTDAELDDVSALRDPKPHTHTPDQVLAFPVVKSYNFSARTLSSGVYYLAGFYDANSNDANLTQGATTVNYGETDHPYCAHVFAVYGGGSTDGANVTLTCHGDSITDAGVHTIGDSEVMYSGPIGDLTINDYLETTKKWMGDFDITLTSDGINFNMDINYGFAKYEDNNNSDFELTGVECVGLADGNDSGFDVELILHTAEGWTYAASGFVPGSVHVASMANDLAPHNDLTDGEHFAWKRTAFGAPIQVNGIGEEGVLLRVTTTVNNSVSYMNAHIAAAITFPPP